MKKEINQILVITFSNTVDMVRSMLKDHIDSPITVRAQNWELERDIEQIIGRDRPRAIIYDGDLPTNTHLKNFHEDILLFISRYDVDCTLYSFEKQLSLRGVILIKVADLKTLSPEPV